MTLNDVMKTHMNGPTLNEPNFCTNINIVAATERKKGQAQISSTTTH